MLFISALFPYFLHVLPYIKFNFLKKIIVFRAQNFWMYSRIGNTANGPNGTVSIEAKPANERKATPSHSEVVYLFQSIIADNGKA